MLRKSCAINDVENEEVLLVTGGETNSTSFFGLAQSRVSRYSRSGWIEDLPEMKQPRSLHGCSSYLGNGERVMIKLYHEA